MGRAKGRLDRVERELRRRDRERQQERNPTLELQTLIEELRSSQKDGDPSPPHVEDVGAVIRELEEKVRAQQKR